jgi:predicted nucleotide-binding protein (sugar kinase/HSP70/actin superfamily)
MLKKLVESNDSVAKNHIVKYVEEKGGIEELRGCITKDVFNDFISYCDHNKFGKIGYHAFRRFLFEIYNVKSKQALTDEGRYYVID